jgi:hypothetical protein
MKKGTQKGNQNARKHGFYSKVLDETEQVQFQAARDIQGIDEEIALLRVKIQSILEHDPENVNLIMRATGILARLIRTKYELDAGQSRGLKEAIGNVMREIAIPLGVKVIGG